MEIHFERIEGKTPAFNLLLLVFAVMAVGGLTATWWALQKGLAVTGMTTRVPWGVQIVMAPEYIPLLDETVMDFVELDDGERQFIFLNPQDSNYLPPQGD